MKYLIMCEGSNEEAIINILLDNNKLIISRDDLIGRRPYNIRQLKHPLIKTSLLHYNDEVIIYRIGDKQNEELVIPNELKRIIKKENIFKYCTKPELEILLIINENLLQEYNKSGLTPKSFAKEKIKYNNKKYDQSSEFLTLYYHDANILINNLREYKRIKKKHRKDELYLIDLIK